MMVHRSGRCEFCGGDETRMLLETHDRLLDGQEKYVYVRCDSCGMTFLDPRPVWEERSRHYSLNYRGYIRTGDEGESYQQLSSHYGFKKRMGIIVQYKRSGRLLDMGAGTGDFVDWLSRKAGWQVIGLEPVTEAIRCRAPHAGALRVVGDTCNVGLSATSLDVVTLWSALEHLQNPLEGLQECLRVLKPGGILVLRTVNSSSWGAGLFSSYWVGYDAPRVVSVFTEGSLSRLLTRVGFTVLETGDYFYDYFPLMWSLENLFDQRIHDRQLRNLLVRLCYSPITRALTFPFFILQRLARKNSFMTMVAQKPR